MICFIYFNLTKAKSICPISIATMFSACLQSLCLLLLLVLDSGRAIVPYVRTALVAAQMLLYSLDIKTPFALYIRTTLHIDQINLFSVIPLIELSWPGKQTLFRNFQLLDVGYKSLDESFFFLLKCSCALCLFLCPFSFFFRVQWKHVPHELH